MLSGHVLILSRFARFFRAISPPYFSSLVVFRLLLIAFGLALLSTGVEAAQVGHANVLTGRGDLYIYANGYDQHYHVRRINSLHDGWVHSYGDRWDRV